MHNLTRIRLESVQVPATPPSWQAPVFGPGEHHGHGMITKLRIYAGTVCPVCRQARPVEGLGYQGMFEDDIRIRCGNCGINFGPTDLDLQEISRQAEEIPQ